MNPKLTAKDYVDHLRLQPHPEGGYYKEIYRSSSIISAGCLPSAFNGDRNFATSIYFLLQQGDYSAFHRIRSDEGWHFYDGGALLIHVIDQTGNYTCQKLGRKIYEGEALHYVVPAGSWFASEPADDTSFALVGCTVSPGFDFADFEMAKEESLLQDYPQHQTIIKRLCR